MDQTFSNEEDNNDSNHSSIVEFYSLKGDIPEEDKGDYNFAECTHRNDEHQKNISYNW